MIILNGLGFLLLAYLCIGLAMGPVYARPTFLGSVWASIRNLSWKFWALWALSIFLISL